MIDDEREEVEKLIVIVGLTSTTDAVVPFVVAAGDALGERRGLRRDGTVGNPLDERAAASISRPPSAGTAGEPEAERETSTAEEVEGEEDDAEKAVVAREEERAEGRVSETAPKSSS